ncbi:MAG: archease [Acidimicrobiia bacterium]|nr:archease [Acidimicrobiia bacterium]MDH3397516.1 archease [Acidimicrobiia bacterium]MDH5615304.1 archease [Acidimicrobiia bacterium]
MKPRYEVLSHTADTGVVVHGSTLREVFESAAFAMFDLIFGIGDLAGVDRVQVEVTAPTVEDLLVDWLSTLLFEAETNDLAFCSFEIDTIDDGHATGWAIGSSVVDLELSGPPIKAVTYHDLRVEKTAGGWSARVVFDV